MKKRYAEIVFLQGHEAEESLDLLLEECGEESAMDYLKQWDMGEYYYDEIDSTGAGIYDREYRNGDYIMIWNRAIGYIGLCLDITNLYPEGRY